MQNSDRLNRQRVRINFGGQKYSSSTNRLGFLRHQLAEDNLRRHGPGHRQIEILSRLPALGRDFKTILRTQKTTLHPSRRFSHNSHNFRLFGASNRVDRGTHAFRSLRGPNTPITNIPKPCNTPKNALVYFPAFLTRVNLG